jgi:hypothetical protein
MTERQLLSPVCIDEMSRSTTFISPVKHPSTSVKARHRSSLHRGLRFRVDLKPLYGQIARPILQGPPSTVIFTKNEHALPEHDRRWIRREMALYAEEWVSVLIPLRADLSEPEARLLTQAVFSMLNTAATLKKGLDEESIFSMMRQAALHAMLGRGDL